MKKLLFDRYKYNIYIIFILILYILPFVLSKSYHTSSNRLTRHDINDNNRNNELLDDYGLSLDDNDLYGDVDVKQLEEDTLEDLNEQDNVLNDYADLSLHTSDNFDEEPAVSQNSNSQEPIALTGDLIRFEAADPPKPTSTSNTRPTPTSRPAPTSKPASTATSTSTTTTPSTTNAPTSNVTATKSTKNPLVPINKDNKTVTTDNQQQKPSNYNVSPFPHTYDEAMHPDDKDVELRYCIPEGAHYDNWPNPKPPMCPDDVQPCVPKGYKVKNIVLPKCPITKVPKQGDSTASTNVNTDIDASNGSTTATQSDDTNKKDDDVYVPLKPKHQKNIHMPRADNVTINDENNKKDHKKQHDNTNNDVTPIGPEPVPTPQVIDLSGYLRLDRLIQRFEHSIRLGRRAAKFDDENDLEICSKRINSLNNTVNHLSEQIKEAQLNLTNAMKKKEENINKIDRLHTLIEPKAKAIADIDDELSKLKAKKKVQLKVYEDRLKDTDVVYEAVNSIFSRLSMSNSSNTMRFREEIFQAAAVVHDASVHSLLENALGAVSGSDKIDITQLRQLFALLLQDLQSYVNIVKKTKSNDDAMWAVTQKQMNAQKLLLQQVVKKWLASIHKAEKHNTHLEHKIIEMQQILDETPSVLSVKRQELNVWNNSCEADAKESEQEKLSASVQLSTIVSMRKALSSHRYYSVGRVLADVVNGIKLPHLMVTKTGKRCCVVCKRGQACGDGCIHPKAKCNMTQPGCACNYDDMSTTGEIMTSHDRHVQQHLEGTRITFNPKSSKTAATSTKQQATTQQTNTVNSQTTTTKTQSKSNTASPRFQEIPQMITLDNLAAVAPIFVGGETISPSFNF